MNGAAVSLRELCKDFGQGGAVQDVSLDIGAGEFLTLLGPSGSGKSTTLMMIAGFETPSAGDITIDGRSVIAVSPHRRNIGMVFQNYPLFPHLNVAANIGFPLKQRGIGRAERARVVLDALALVRLPGYEARYPRPGNCRADNRSAWRSPGHRVQAAAVADGRAARCAGQTNA